MTEDQVKHMVQRFLGWKLPDSFCPDNGIIFQKTYGEGTKYPGKYEPVGTNLFDAKQTEAMIRYLVDGLPESIVKSIPGWVIVAPGPRFLAVQHLETSDHFEWAENCGRALVLLSENQAGLLLNALRQLDRTIDDFERRLFAFEVQLGNAMVKQCEITPSSTNT